MSKFVPVSTPAEIRALHQSGLLWADVLGLGTIPWNFVRIYRHGVHYGQVKYSLGYMED